MTSTRGRPEHARRQDLDAGDPAAVGVPDRAAAEQRQRLGDVVAAGAHVGGAPGRERHLARPGAVALQVLLDHEPGRAPAELPGGRRRHGAAVDRVEVAAGRQDLGPPAGRGTARAGCHAATVEARQQAGELGSTAVRERRAKMPLDGLQDGTGGRPAGFRPGLAGDQPAGEQLQALDRVAFGPPGAGAGQHRRARAGPRLAEGGPEGVPVERQIGGQGPQQRRVAGLAAPSRHARQGHQQVGERVAFGRAAEDVQPVADLQLLDLAQMVVDAGEMVGVVRVDAEVAGEAQRLAALQDALAQMLQPARIEGGGLVVLVDQGLECRELAPALRPGHRRGQVVDDDRTGPPLGLGPFAGIVDDERVEVRQGAEDRLGQAGGGQGGGLARQPFEVAVLAEVDDGMGAEAVAQPEVEGEVAVRRGQVRRVVGRVRVDVVAARGLQADHDVAEQQDGEGEAVAGQVRVVLRRAPALDDAGPDLGGEPGEQIPVGVEGECHRDRAGSTAGELVGRAGGEPGHECGTVRRRVGDRVAGAGQGRQHLDAARGHVQADAVGEPAVAGRVVGEHDGDLAPGRGCPAQARPGGGQGGEVGDPVRHRAVAREHGLGEGVALAMMLERDRHGTDAAVHLGQCHVHGEVARSQPARPGPPCVLGGAGEDGLEDRRVGGRQRIGARSAVDRTHRERGGVEQDVRPLTRDRLVEQGGARRVLQARQVEAGGGEAGLRQGVEQGVDGRQVAALQEGAVEDQEGRRPAALLGCRPVQAGAGQRRGLAPGGRAPEQCCGVAQRLLGIVDPAMLQVAAEAVIGLGGYGRECRELEVGALVAGQAGQCNAPLGTAGRDLLQAVGPVGAAAQQADDDQPGVRDDAVDVKVDRQGMAELEQVGEAQARGIGAEPGLGSREAGKVGVRGGEEDDLARGLAEVDSTLDVAAVGLKGAQEMHACRTLKGRPQASSGRAAGRPRSGGPSRPVRRASDAAGRPRRRRRG